MCLHDTTFIFINSLVRIRNRIKGTKVGPTNSPYILFSKSFVHEHYSSSVVGPRQIVGQEPPRLLPASSRSTLAAGQGYLSCGSACGQQSPTFLRSSWFSYHMSVSHLHFSPKFCYSNFCGERNREPFRC